MATRTSPFRAPFPRRLLIRIHRDLLKIDSYLVSDAEYTSELDLVEIMVLISEDRRFFRHNGIDWLSVLRVLSGVINLRFYGGASTIDMQFIRTATGFYEKSLRRKIYEMLLARIIQYRYSKAQILRSYLSCAFLGSGVYGVSRASVVVFDKMTSELCLTEAAQLASMLVYPRPLVPDMHWKSKLDRRSKYLVSLYPSLKERFEKLPSWDAV